MGEVLQFEQFRRKPGDRPEHVFEEMRHIDQAIAVVKLLKPNQAANAARNLGQLLDEAIAAGLTRAQIASEVERWKDMDLPSKRLDRFLLPRRQSHVEGQAEAAIKRRTAGLARRPDGTGGPYVGFKQVGEAIARLMQGRPDWEREQVLVRLFRGTPVDQALKSLVDRRREVAANPDGCWEMLSERLHDFANSVARRAGLSEHQRRCARTLARFDLADERIYPYGGCLFAHGPLNNNFESWQEFPPVPSVVLFEEPLAQQVPTSLTLGPLEKDSTPQPMNLTAEVWREVRLAIGPADVVDRASPLFEVRTRVDLDLNGQLLPLRRPWLFLGREEDEDVEVPIAGEIRTGRISFPRLAPDGRSWASLLAWPSDTSVSGALQPEHSYAAWRLVTPELCAEMLGPDRADLPSQGVYVSFERTDRPTVTPEGSLGALVEQALLDDAGPRLDRVLLQQANLMVARVRSYVDGRRLEALRMHDAAVARWMGNDEEA